MITTSVSGEVLLICFSSSIPFISGISRSVSTRLNDCSFRRSTASRPFEASATRYPSFPRTKERDCRMISSSSTLRTDSGSLVILRIERQDNGERRPLPLFALHGDVAPETPHDTVAHPESQPGSLPYRFRGEERFEHLGEIILRDPRSVVADRHPDMRIVPFEFARDHPLLPFQGVDGIEQDVDEDLCDLVGD